MILTKINEKGKFENWSPVTLKELRRGSFTMNIGRKLYESDEFKIWKINLEPGERLPFRAHFNTYICNCLTDGLLISRNVNGEIDMIRFNVGDNYYRECKKVEVHDLQNIGENPVIITVTEVNPESQHYLNLVQRN